MWRSVVLILAVFPPVGVFKIVDEDCVLATFHEVLSLLYDARVIEVEHGVADIVHLYINIEVGSHNRS
ncbi:hypothetical protein D3C72_2521330 [compost metagenome]